MTELYLTDRGRELLVEVLEHSPGKEHLVTRNILTELTEGPKTRQYLYRNIPHSTSWIDESITTLKEINLVIEVK